MPDGGFEPKLPTSANKSQQKLFSNAVRLHKRIVSTLFLLKDTIHHLRVQGLHLPVGQTSIVGSHDRLLALPTGIETSGIARIAKTMSTKMPEIIGASTLSVECPKTRPKIGG